MHRIINIHQKSLSKEGHHENDSKVLVKGFQPSHADTLQLLLFPTYKLTASFSNLMGLFANIFCLCSDFFKSNHFKRMKYSSLHTLPLNGKTLSPFQRQPMQAAGRFVRPQQFTSILEKLK